MALIPGPLELHLTKPDPALEEKRRRTQPGMAHWAGSGPPRRTCRECKHWSGCGSERGYYARKGMYGGTIKPRSCEKHRDLMQGNVGPGVPHDTAACKYFEDDGNAPPICMKS